MNNNNKKQNMKKIFYTLHGNSMLIGGGIKSISLTEKNVPEPHEVTVLTKDGEVITRTQINEDKR